ncbi:TolC family outer membrane protein [Rhizobium sp. CECT 9324]|uniref:TolC family outer membrane protein n=1 Tax=Rhizobium sp. CECT 9324 TaxID=2845820 RepID=UPI001E44BBE0|nr:TolC family outer membrane protein [Rhizobium sp. CECT 9324]CAH0342857.1 Outer membrane efflux protein BepC [Rhizobium sp. CECT 9324]
MLKNNKIIALLYASVALGCGMCAEANAMSLQEAVEKTLRTNPQVMQAVKNREAVEFELRQARGLYLPSIDLEAGVGARRLSNSSTGNLTDDSEDYSPADVGLTITQTLLDGGGRRAQLSQQASRVDGASFRVVERSETLALQVVQDYLEYLLQSQIVGVAQQNVSFHNQILGDIGEGIKGGALTDVDNTQGRERLDAARARLREAQEELEVTKIRFLKTVGEPIGKANTPPSLARFIPRKMEEAIAIAQQNNPRIHSARADINAADAAVDAARSNYAPTVNLEGSARVGNDIDGDEGRTEDLQVRVVARWNLYRGGIDQAREQEQVRRASEQRYVSAEVYREVEESIRSAWNERSSRTQLSQILASQSSQNAKLVSSYREQFSVGQRSLLDVLDAQNTRFNTSIIAETAKVASLFAEYKILAASGSLLKSMNLKPVQQAEAYARSEFSVKSDANPTYVEVESRQSSGVPMDLLAPIR